MNKRVYVAPAIGGGSSLVDAIRPAIPAGTAGDFYPRGGQFLIATDADLTAVAGVTELTGTGIDDWCATWGINRAELVL
jgi:hypothetical protein